MLIIFLRIHGRTPMINLLIGTRNWRIKYLYSLEDSMMIMRVSEVKSWIKLSSIEEIYSKVEVKEQWRSVMVGKKTVVHPEMKTADRSVPVNRGAFNQTRSYQKCKYYKKNGYTVDFCGIFTPRRKKTITKKIKRIHVRIRGRKNT